MEPIPDRLCLELSVGGRKLKDMDFLSKSDPFVLLYVRDEHAALVGVGPEVRDALVSVSSGGSLGTSSQPTLGSAGSLTSSRASLITALGWTLLGKTETIWDNLDPNFVQKFYFPYDSAEAKQISLRAVIYDQDNENTELRKQDLIGFCEFKLHEVMQSGSLQVPLNNARGRVDNKCGFGYFVGEEMLVPKTAITRYDVGVMFTADSEIPRSMREPRKLFIIISRQAKRPPGLGMIDGGSVDWVPVYRSGTINPPGSPGHEFKFQEFEITSLRLYANDESRPFRLDLYIYDKKGDHILAGFIETSIRDLRREVNDNSIAMIPGRRDADLRTGVVHINTAWSRGIAFPNVLTFRIAKLSWGGRIKTGSILHKMGLR